VALNTAADRKPERVGTILVKKKPATPKDDRLVLMRRVACVSYSPSSCRS
jgi:hypothetical protein